MEDVERVPTNRNREPLTIFKTEDCWWVCQGEPLNPGYKEQKVSCDSSLISVIQAIEEKFPDRYQIVLDDSVTKNPFTRRSIQTSKTYGFTLPLAMIQDALDHPEMKHCLLCNGDAWYNSHVRGYECWNCGSHEVGGKFIKLRRRY